MKTSYYGSKLIEAAKHFPARTSIGAPRFAKVKVTAAAPLLYPTRDLLGLDFDEYKPAYLALLRQRGITAIREELSRIEANADGRELVLCCFESLKEPEQFCHRRIFAEWWERETGEKIAELGREVAKPTQAALL